MCKKFNQYFEYALKLKKDSKKAMKKGFVECTTSQECGSEGNVKFCCADAVFHHKASGSKDNTYRCMSKKVADRNINVNIGDFEVQMRCVDSVGSGATYLTAGLTAATLVAASLY